MEDLYKKILQLVGENINRKELQNTPIRAAKIMRYFTSGYSENIRDILKDSLFESDNKGLIVIKGIEIYSLCEHHLLPFFGKCYIGYLPSMKILGLSTIIKITKFFSRRLQIQERLTIDIANCIKSSTNALGVSVVIKAKHLCMMINNKESNIQDSTVMTSIMLGEMDNNIDKKIEFFNLIKN